MPSQEFTNILNFMKAVPDTSGLSFEAQRAGQEAGVAMMPIAANVRSQSLKIGNTPAEWLIPPEIEKEAVIFYLHGGGYCVCSMNTHRSMLSFLAKAAKAKILMIDYRLAPEHPFPAAVEDAVAAYQWLLAEGISSNKITIAGDSAGGGLTMATLVALKDMGEPLPAAAACLSPWVDLEGMGESMTSNADIDPVVKKDGLLKMAKAYLVDIDPRNPLAAPLYADLKGLPPLLIQVGSTETLLDDSIRLAEKAEQAGVEVTLEKFENMFHVWQAVVGLNVPEAVKAVDGIAKFVQQHVTAQD